MNVKGLRVVVMGGTSGIGRALALGFAKNQAHVTATSRSQEAVDQLAEEMEALSGAALLRMASDVTDRASLIELRDAVLKIYGGVDVLVNCAGTTKRVPTLDMDEALWNNIMDVNLTGTLRSCQVFAGPMLEQKFGRIINMASLATFVAFQEVAAYGASKAAVGALTRSLAVEWAARGVTVNAIAPGIFPTSLNTNILNGSRGQELLMRTPMGRFGKAEELISTALHLADRDNGYTTGQILVVDGGMLASGVNQ